MKVEHINPFVAATSEVFTTMLQCTPERGQMMLHDKDTEECGGPYHITAIIGLTGTVKGTTEMSFPESTALAISNKLAGEENTEINESVVDALGEMVNMVAGAAKAKFAGHKISVSLPTVIKGKDHWIQHPSGTKSLIIPFDSELGRFVVKVSFEQTS